MTREEIIRQAQQRQMKMFRHFDEVCKKNNIKYFVAYGTALGAVRHHGFIPWDDDIDVGMLRKDYNKLRALPKSVWGEDYILITPESADVRHDKLFGRVYLKNSHIQSYRDVKGWKYWDSNKAWSTSLMLDIFVFDFVPDDEAERNAIYGEIFHNYRYLYLISKMRPVTDQKDIKSILKNQKAQLHGRFLRMKYKEPWRYFAGRYAELVKNSSKGSKIGCYATTGYYASAFNKSENVWYYDYKDFFPLTTMQFEDMTVPVPHEWDKLLHLWYDSKDGEYMSPPPEDQRYHIDFVYLDFGDGTKIVVDPIKGSLGEGQKSDLTAE